MSSAREYDGAAYDVVVVGAGPAGLVAAGTMARAGVRCLLVDRRAEVAALPRATVVSLRNMELMRSWGLEEQVLAGADDVTLQLLMCETLATAARGDVHDVGYPSAAQSAVLSPTAAACVAQDHLESVVRAHVAALPEVDTWFGVDLDDVRLLGEGAAVRLRDESGERAIVHARYVVGADGAHSATRRHLGVEMHGDDDLLDAILVEFRAPLWDVVGEQRYVLYGLTHPEAPDTVLPAGNGDRWLLGIHWDRTTERIEEYTEARLARRIATAAGVNGLRPRIERIGTFTFAAMLAERFRRGDVFLVGDAAHRITPRGGTGMNTAIADGRDLGWKLAWVLRGWAPARLLDTYEAERRPVAEHNLGRSADPAGSRREVIGEVHVDLGGRLAHHWLPGRSARRSTVDVVGDGLTLFASPDAGAWTRAGTAPDASDLPVAVVPLDALTARALGIARGAVLAVRPDGVPVGRWSAEASVDRCLDEARRAATAGGPPVGEARTAA